MVFSGERNVFFSGSRPPMLSLRKADSEGGVATASTLRIARVAARQLAQVAEETSFDFFELEPEAVVEAPAAAAVLQETSPEFAVMEACKLRIFVASPPLNEWIRERGTVCVLLRHAGLDRHRLVSGGQLNTPVYNGMVLAEVRPAFVQWRDKRLSYMLSFDNAEDAKLFVDCLVSMGAVRAAKSVPVKKQATMRVRETHSQSLDKLVGHVADLMALDRAMDPMDELIANVALLMEGSDEEYDLYDDEEGYEEEEVQDYEEKVVEEGEAEVGNGQEITEQAQECVDRKEPDQAPAPVVEIVVVGSPAEQPPVIELPVVEAQPVLEPLQPDPVAEEAVVPTIPPVASESAVPELPEVLPSTSEIVVAAAPAVLPVVAEIVVTNAPAVPPKPARLQRMTTEEAIAKLRPPPPPPLATPSPPPEPSPIESPLPTPSPAPVESLENTVAAVLKRRPVDSHLEGTSSDTESMDEHMVRLPPVASRKTGVASRASRAESEYVPNAEIDKVVKGLTRGVPKRLVSSAQQQPQRKEEVKKAVNTAMAQWMGSSELTLRRVITLSTQEKTPTKSAVQLRSLARNDSEHIAPFATKRTGPKIVGGQAQAEDSEDESSDFVDIDLCGTRWTGDTEPRFGASYGDVGESEGGDETDGESVVDEEERKALEDLKMFGK